MDSDQVFSAALRYSSARAIFAYAARTDGYNWRRWVLRNRFKQPQVKKVIPQKHQVKKLISMDLEGNGTICKRLLDEFQNVSRHTTYTR